MTTRTHFVYRAYDDYGLLLYVGITGNPRARWAQHRASSTWAQYATHFRLAGPYPQPSARELERAAIKGECPYFNSHSGLADQRTQQRRDFVAELFAQSREAHPDLWKTKPELVWSAELDRIGAVADAKYPPLRTLEDRHRSYLTERRQLILRSA